MIQGPTFCVCAINKLFCLRCGKTQLYPFTVIVYILDFSAEVAQLSSFINEGNHTRYCNTPVPINIPFAETKFQEPPCPDALFTMGPCGRGWSGSSGEATAGASSNNVAGCSDRSMPPNPLPVCFPIDSFSAFQPAKNLWWIAYERFKSELCLAKSPGRLFPCTPRKPGALTRFR